MTAIQSIAFALPERVLTNSDLEREHPSWDMARVAERTGVLSRHVAAPDETAFDLSVRACEALFARSEIELGAIDAILYCTQNPDYRMPGNAHLLHRHLGMDDRVLAFDYTLACSGYVYGLAFADSFVRAGLASEVLLVTAETYSKQIDPEDRAAWAVFGDGAAVTHVSGVDEGGGRILASGLCTSGEQLERIYIPFGGARAPRSEVAGLERDDRRGAVSSTATMQMDGPGLWAFANSAVPRHLSAFLATQSLTVEDVDVYVFHQASALVLESLAKALKLDPDKVVVSVAEVGNLVSASIPVALRTALDEGRIQAGDRVVLCGFGVGLSYGSVLVEF